MKASPVNPDPDGTPALAVRGLSVAYGDMAMETIGPDGSVALYDATK